MKGNLYTENEKKIKILYIGKSEYNVISCSKLKFRNKNYVGFINYDTKEIFLKKGYDKETLNHEIIHAFLNELYLKTKRKDIKKLRSEEGFIEDLCFLLRKLKWKNN